MNRLNQNEGECVQPGPEIVFLDTVPPRGCPEAGDLSAATRLADRSAAVKDHASMVELAARLRDAGTRRVVLGWAADPVQHPRLPELVAALLSEKLEVSVASSFHDAAPAVLRQLDACEDLELVIQVGRPEQGPPPMTQEALRELGRRSRTCVHHIIDPEHPDALTSLPGWAAGLNAGELHLAVDHRFGAPVWSARALLSLQGALSDLARRLIFPTENGITSAVMLKEGPEAPALPDGGLAWDERTGFSWDPEHLALICPEGRSSRRCFIEDLWPDWVAADFDMRVCEICPRQTGCAINLVTEMLRQPCLRVVGLRELRALINGAAPSEGCPLPRITAWVDASGDLWTCRCRLPCGMERVTNLLEDRDWASRWQEALERHAGGAGAAGGCACVPRDCAFLHPCQVAGVVRDLLSVQQDERRAEAHRLATPPSLLRDLERLERVRLRTERDRAWLAIVVDRCHKRLRQRSETISHLERLYALQCHKLRALRRRRVRPDPQLSRSGPRPDDIVLVMAPMWGHAHPPLNLALLAENLRHNGVRVGVVDLNIELFNSVLDTELERNWIVDVRPDIDVDQQFRLLEERFEGPMQAAVEQILSSGVPLVGFSVNVRNRLFVQKMSRLIREADPRRLVVVGGPEILGLYNRGHLDDPDVHLYLIGEAEETLLEIVLRHRSGGSLDGVLGCWPGAAMGVSGRVSYVPRSPPQDLDRLPFPTYAGFNIENYASDEMPFLFSRGCFGNCPYCSDRALLPGFRCRSGEHAFAEMEHHVRQHGAYGFHFNDLMCNGDISRLVRLCELVVEGGLEIQWGSYAKIRSEMTPELLAKMRRSGCISLHYGLESGSNAMLARMRKTYDTKLAEQVLRDTSEAGIATGINIIVGYLGESEYDFEQTCQFLRRNRDCISSVINLSSIDISQGELGEAPDRFGIIATQDGGWLDETGLDSLGRQRRLQTIKELLSELYIELSIVNYHH